MELYVALIQAISILAFTGSTVVGYETYNVCEFAEDGLVSDFHGLIVYNVKKCLVNVGYQDVQTLVDTRDEAVVATFFKEYCQNYQLMENCLSRMSKRFSMCINDTQKSASGFTEDVLKTALRYGCTGSGRHLASVMFAVFNKENSTSTRNDFIDCLAIANSTDVDGNTLESSSKEMRFFRKIKVFKQCLVNRVRGHNRAVYGAELTLNGILHSIPCPGADNGVWNTWCEAVDSDTSTKETVCPFVGTQKGEAPSFGMFIDFLTECALVNTNQLDFDELKNFTAIHNYQYFFNTYCGNRQQIAKCLDDVVPNSRLCQNQTTHQFLELISDFLGQSLQIGCEQNGTSLATIANGILNREERAIGWNKTTECVKTAERTLKSVNLTDDEVSYSAGQGLNNVISLKRCILDGVFDVNSFTTVFSTFVDDILKARTWITVHRLSLI